MKTTPVLRAMKGELGTTDTPPPGPYSVGMTKGPHGETAPPWTVVCGDGRAIAGHVPSREIAQAIALAMNRLAGADAEGEEVLRAPLDVLPADPKHQRDASDDVANYFRKMGASDLGKGRLLFDCPVVASALKAAEWWREGLLDAIRRAGADVGRNDDWTGPKPPNPYFNGTKEADAWDEGCCAPARLSRPRRPGRPRKLEEGERR